MTPLIVYDKKHKQIWQNPDIELLVQIPQPTEEDQHPYASTRVNRAWVTFDGRDPDYDGDITLVAISAAADRLYHPNIPDDLEEDAWNTAWAAHTRNPVLLRAAYDDMLKGYRAIRAELKLPVAKNISWSPDCVLYRDEDDWGYDT